MRSEMTKVFDEASSLTLGVGLPKLNDGLDWLELDDV